MGRFDLSSNGNYISNRRGLLKRLEGVAVELENGRFGDQQAAVGQLVVPIELVDLAREHRLADLLRLLQGDY